MTNSSPTSQATALSNAQELEELSHKVLQNAVQQHQAGQIDLAEELYRSLLELRPDYSGAHYHLGLLEAQTQRLPDAIAHFEAALTLQPEHEQYWLGYIDALTQAGHAEIAQQVLELGRQYGLQGEEVENWAMQLAASRK
ncbi:MAG: tetratricopeptide repeat protein [Burkholderiaceae bacterium]